MYCKCVFKDKWKARRNKEGVLKVSDLRLWNKAQKLGASFTIHNVLFYYLYIW